MIPLTIALLLMIAAMIGIISLHLQTNRNISRLIPDPEQVETGVSQFLDALECGIEAQVSEDIIQRFTELKAAVLAEGRKTRKDVLQTLVTASAAGTEELRAAIRTESEDQYVGAVSMTNAAVEQLSEKIEEDGKKTRERIGQIKTREADEEQEDQRAKANDRLKERRGKRSA
jgi:hypothetical protein